MTQREIIKPKIGVPETVVLDRGPEGKETRGKRGLEYQYTLNNDQAIIWLPPEARTALIRSGAQAGDSVRLLQRRDGWNVQVIGDAAAPEPPPPPAAPPRLVAPQPPYANGHANGHATNGHTAAPDPATTHPVEALMERCLVAGGRAMWRAYQKLLAEGCDFDKPMIEDVRATGITLYIERTRPNGGAR